MLISPLPASSLSPLSFADTASVTCQIPGPGFLRLTLSLVESHVFVKAVKDMSSTPPTSSSSSSAASSSASASWFDKAKSAASAAAEATKKAAVYVADQSKATYESLKAPPTTSAAEHVQRRTATPCPYAHS